jgi:hypothetical protein
MAYNVDLFGFLNSLSKGVNPYREMTEIEQKELQPVIIYRWLSGCSSGHQVQKLAELNHFIFTISDKATLFDLMAAACDGKSYRYKWIKPAGSQSAPICLKVIMTAYNCSEREAIGYLPKLDANDIYESAEMQGMDDATLTKLIQELKNGHAKTTFTGSEPTKRAKRTKRA